MSKRLSNIVPAIIIILYLQTLAMATDTSNPTSHNVVVRLLNSPLCGCEFLLFPGRTLFVVGERSSLVTDDNIPELPADTLFIPLEQGGINFEVVFHASSPADLSLREVPGNENNAREHKVTFNHVIHVGALALALRPENQTWSPEILAYPKTRQPVACPRRPRYAVPLTALTIVAVLLLTGGYWLWNSPQQQANELGILLGNENQRFQILPGRDKILYVLSTNERDATWAQQVIARGENSDPAKVISPARENERLSRWLADNYPSLAYYRLQLDDPSQPQLWISRQRSSMAMKDLQALNSRLMSLLPYTNRIDIIPIDDATAVRQAETELKRQALPYSRNDQIDGVTFVIEGALDDGELLRARHLVDNYYRQWGGRYVQFAIELKDDWLKGRSFQYGDQGYVKMSPGHWYFPKPL